MRMMDARGARAILDPFDRPNKRRRASAGTSLFREKKRAPQAEAAPDRGSRITRDRGIGDASAREGSRRENVRAYVYDPQQTVERLRRASQLAKRHRALSIAANVGVGCGSLGDNDPAASRNEAATSPDRHLDSW